MAAAQDLLVDNIKSKLKERGLKGYQFADALGVDKSLVSRWLQKKVPVGLEYFDNIARVLGVQVWQLFEDPERRSKLDLETALRVVAEHARAGAVAKVAKNTAK